jgi:hypothetical protein
MKALHLYVGVAIVAASIAGPILVWRRLQTAVHDQSERLERQEMEIATLTQEIQRLSNSSSPGKAALPDEQMRDLLRLRAEAAALRRQTNESAGLALKNSRPDSQPPRPDDPASPQSEDELAAELSTDTLEAMKGVLQELPGVVERFAQDHSGKAPEQFSELRKYFPKVDGARMPGLYTFQFVREEGPKPGDTLILKEQSFRSRDDKAWRIYGFSDGKMVELSVPDGDETQRNFARWESQYLDAVPGQVNAAPETK